MHAPAAFLTAEQVRRIHEAALEILEQVWTIGLAKTGNEIGLNEAEIGRLAPDDLKAKLARAYTRMAQCGAHYVVDGIEGVPAVLDDINARLARGDRP